MKPNKARKQLFRYLDDGLALSHKKLHMRQKKDEDRLAWGRLMVNMINAYGKLLDTEELEQRIVKLEEQVKDGVVIASEKHE